MKCILILSILAALVGGCAVAPPGYGEGERGYTYPSRNYNDGNYHHYSDRSERGNRGDTQPGLVA